MILIGACKDYPGCTHMATPEYKFVTTLKYILLEALVVTDYPVSVDCTWQ
jgi:hypothetical protein